LADVFSRRPGHESFLAATKAKPPTRASQSILFSPTLGADRETDAMATTDEGGFLAGR
jgi:hypothetical protein